MTIEEIKDRLKEIQEESNDDAVAHSSEDGLYLSLLASIAEGTCENPKECAALAITASDIKFSRWYA